MLSAMLPVKAENFDLQVGQSWSFKDAPTPQARVIIGKIEIDAEPKIIHVFVQGLPDLLRDPSPVGKGVAIQNVGGRKIQLSCEYVLAPSADKKTTTLSVRHLPMRYEVLIASLVSVDTTLIEPDIYFERTWDKWDYHRDLYGVNTPQTAISALSVAETVDIIIADASRTMSLLESMPLELEEDENPDD